MAFDQECLAPINVAVTVCCAKIDHWVNASQWHRWLAAAVLDIEPRLRKAKGYRYLPKLRVVLQQELKIKQAASNKVADYPWARARENFN